MEAAKENKDQEKKAKRICRSIPWKSIGTLILAVIQVLTSGLAIKVCLVGKQYNNQIEEEIQNINSQFQISQEEIRADIAEVKQTFFTSHVEENTTINNITSMFNENTSAETLLAYSEKPIWWRIISL